MMNVRVRFHYDKMRRVSEERYDYYFAPLNYTPFTLGLAIPSTYGQTLIKVDEEIKNNRFEKKNMSKLFLGQNWKVHPDWYARQFPVNCTMPLKMLFGANIFLFLSL